MSLRIFLIIVFISLLVTNPSTMAVGFYTKPCEDAELTKKTSEEALAHCISENYSNKLDVIQKKCKETIIYEIQSVSKLKACQVETKPFSKK